MTVPNRLAAHSPEGGDGSFRQTRVLEAAARERHTPLAYPAGRLSNV
jgi:hypothetical protein